MCMVSMVTRGFEEQLPKTYPWVTTPPPITINPSIPAQPNTPQIPVNPSAVPFVAQTEIAALRKELEELKKVLKAAKIYDEATGQPECEMDEKIALLRKLAELVGITMEDVFPSSPAA